METQDQSTAAFSIGQAAKASQKQMSAQELEDKRKGEVFLIGNSLDEQSKRNREDYAVKLRKQRRDDFFKQKRANLQRDESASTATEGMEIEIDTGKASQIQLISIQDALTKAQTLPKDQVVKTLSAFAYKLEEFIEIVQLIQHESDDYILVGLIALRKLLSRIDDPPYQQTITSGVAVALVRLASRQDHNEIKHEALWSLTNIACGEGTAVALIELEILKLLHDTISAPESSVRVLDQAIWCVGNIAGENSSTRDLVIMNGFVQPIAAAIERNQGNPLIERNASWCLSNLCKGTPPSDPEALAIGIPSLAGILARSENIEMINDICWGLSYFTNPSTQFRLKCIVDSGVLPKLTQLMEHAEYSIATPCIRIIGNILSSPDRQLSSSAMNAGVLNGFCRLVDHPKLIIRKEVFWSLSNVTAESADAVDACLQSGILRSAILHLRHDVDPVKRECIYSIVNAIQKSTADQISQIVEAGFLTAANYACDMKEESDVLLTLEAVRMILEVGMATLVDGENPYVLKVEDCALLDKIEELQECQSQEIYLKAKDILEKFFQEDEPICDIEEENVARQTAGQDLPISYEETFNI